MHLPSARLHAGHAMATVQAAIELGRNAPAIILDHDQKISILQRLAPLCLMMLLLASRKMRVVCT